MIEYKVQRKNSILHSSEISNQRTAESLYGSVLNDTVDCLKPGGTSYPPLGPGLGVGLPESAPGAIGDGGISDILILSFLKRGLATDMRYVSDEGEPTCAASGFCSETGRYEILEPLEPNSSASSLLGVSSIVEMVLPAGPARPRFLGRRSAFERPRKPIEEKGF